jgi:transmembrane 9 superfamily protein 3
VYIAVAIATMSFVAGIVSASLFRRYSSREPTIADQWRRCAMYTASLFPGLQLLVWSVCACVTIAQNSSGLKWTAFGRLLDKVILWALIAPVFVAAGTLVIRRREGQQESATGEHRHDYEAARLAPRRPKYLRLAALAVTSGVIPVGSFFLELYVSHKYFFLRNSEGRVYGFLWAVLTLLFVTACVAVVATYFMLNSEEHRWQWNSFIIGSSVSGYVFLYAAYFYFFELPRMRLEPALNFSAVAIFVCTGLGVLCGAVAFATSSTFVNRLFTSNERTRRPAAQRAVSGAK